MSISSTDLRRTIDKAPRRKIRSPSGLKPIEPGDFVPRRSQPHVVTHDELALRKRLVIDMRLEQIRSLRQDIDERKKYAEKSFKLVAWWVLSVFILLLLHGFFANEIRISLGGVSIELGSKLPDSVLLSVVGGATVSIIGIFLVVANYLFQKR